MGFCGFNCACGHGCSSSDDWCQHHDCGRPTCPVHRSPPVVAGENLKKPMMIVRHSTLDRTDTGSESVFRSWCPVCHRGLLLVKRIQATLQLSRFDNCTLCGQLIFYEETEIEGMPLVSPFPLTLEEAVAALPSGLSDVDREEIRQIITGSQSGAEDLASMLHHSLGQCLRNEWRLWQGSPLALDLAKNHGVEHPDDMSHLIIATYCKTHLRTAWDRIRAGDPF